MEGREGGRINSRLLATVDLTAFPLSLSLSQSARKMKLQSGGQKRRGPFGLGGVGEGLQGFPIELAVSAAKLKVNVMTH